MFKQVALTTLACTALTAGVVLLQPLPQAAPQAPAPVTHQSPTTSHVLVVQSLRRQTSLSLVSASLVTPAPAAVAPNLMTSPAHLTYASQLAATVSGNQVVGSDGARYPLHQYTATSLPNDPQASQPWVSSATVSSAWDIPHGAGHTLLAIIDTGFALKHQEFSGRWYTNPGEVGPTTVEAPSRLNCTDRGLPLDQSCNLIDDNGDGIVDNESGPTSYEKPSQLNCTDRGLPLDKSCNLMDNDGNGLINDVHGYDFADNNSSVQAGEINSNGAGTHHGTYTTGVAAATGNNGVGIAGVDWSTTILPIQALDDNGSGNTAGVTNAINYAVSQHANVISMSLGSAYDDPLVHQAVDRAIAAGISVVAAAGNDGCNCMLYPANYPEVISVGAADANGNPASFSSYGSSLKLLAPGVNLYTTDWQPNNQTSAYASGISGTSLATPIVAGLLTLLLSQQPTATPAQLLAALLENTNRSGLAVGSPRNDSYGFGMIDAGAATRRMNTSYAPVQVYSFGGLSIGTEVAGGYTYQCSNGATAMYKLSGSRTTFTRSAVESTAAQAQGSTASLFSYGCMSEPQDQPLVVRTINMAAEFLNESLTNK
jgi:subtilisin family serine protease